MMKLKMALAAGILATFIAAPARACHTNDTCTVRGVTYRCDKCFGDRSCGPIQGNDVCPGTCTLSATTCLEQSDCTGGGDDQCSFTGDGNKVSCYGSSADTISGTSGRDIICAGGGDDTIDAKGGDDEINAEAGDDVINAAGGNDIVEGGSGDDLIDGGGGDDLLYAGNFLVPGTGNDVIFGGDGDDSISGGTGNDQLFGEGDDDIINGMGGRNGIFGGAGDDVLFAGGVLSSPSPDSNLGSVLCGDDGNDVLWGWGPGHQCMDGGTGQTSPLGSFGGTSFDCSYAYVVDSETVPTTEGSPSPTVFDLGTAANCGTPVGTGLTVDDSISCGCGG
jgi:RTX calcium-binding nonapeptide repeat (4 copies)